MVKDYWVSNKILTCLITVKDGKVYKTCPILSKFIGQPLDNLINWMKKQSGFMIEEIE